MNLLVHTRVILTYGDIFANYLNPTEDLLYKEPNGPM